MDSSSYDSETSLISSSKRKRVNDGRSNSFLPDSVSKWNRKHLENVLGIAYAKRYVPDPENFKISESIEELTEEQKEYIEFINNHLTLNLSLNQFNHSSSYAEKAIIECATNIELLQAQQKSWSVMKLKAFIRGLRILFKNMRDYRKRTHPFEGLITGFIGKFAELCHLDVEYCNDAHQVVWENLNGIKVTSVPDLRLFQCGLDDTYSEMRIPVVQVKPDYCYNQETRGPLRKKFKGSELSFSDTGDQDSMSRTIEEEDIELQLHDRLLGQHAGQLLLDLHFIYGKDEEEKYEGEKKLNMLGMIVDGTSVFFTVLEITWRHYQKLKKNEDLHPDDKATIYYSQPKDILIERERRLLIADFMRLNNIEITN